MFSVSFWLVWDYLPEAADSETRIAVQNRVAESLRRAQVAMVNSAQSHRFDWAAFQATGAMQRQ